MATITALPEATTTPAGSRELSAAVRWSLLGSLVAVALTLVSRRISGAFVLPLSGWGLIGVSVFSGWAAAAVRWLGGGVLQTSHMQRSIPYSVFNTEYSVRAASGLLLFALPGLAAVLLLAAVTLPGSLPFGLLTAWFLLALAEATAWLPLIRNQQRPVRNSAAEAETPLAEAELPPNLVQQVTRVLDEAGGESIHAVLRAVVPANDRQSALHVAFCPPLAAVPELTAHALECEAEVRITQAELFGARIEVRVPRATAAEQVLLVELLGSVKGQSA